MLCILHCLDHPDAGDLRAATRAAHLDYAAGRNEIRVAGPLLSDDGEQMIGSLFIIEVDSLDDARAFSAADPYVEAGVFAQVDIHPFRHLVGSGLQRDGT